MEYYKDLFEDDNLEGEGVAELDDDGTDNRKRTKLIQSLEKVFPGAKKKGREAIRREASKDAAEFVAVKRKTGATPTFNKLLQSAKETGEGKAVDKVTKLVKAPSNKQLQTLETPLEQPQALKAKRVVLYDQVKKDVSRFNSIVYHNRLADQLTFPLNAGKKVSKKSARDIANDFIPMTPLEEEMAKVLYGEDYVKQKKAELEKPLGPSDAESYMLSVEEALATHSEMARLRALQSYQMVKAKRQNKIKSKKYHRLLRKEKIKKQLKDFEALQQKDPEAAMVKLDELEHSRVTERMSLKHRNTSKWAKMQSARAKYNKDSRIALSEQLKISRDLTQNVQESSDSEEDLDLELPQLVKSSMDNPWMLKPEVKENEKMQLYYTGYKKLWEQINAKKEKERKKEEVESSKESQEKKEDQVEFVDKLDALNSLMEKEDKEKEEIVAEVQKEQKKKGKKRKNKVQKHDKKSKILKKQITEEEDSPEEETTTEKTFTLEDVSELVEAAEEKIRRTASKKLKQLEKQEKYEKRRKEKLKEKLELAKLKKSKKSTSGDIDEIKDLEINPEEQNSEEISLTKGTTTLSLTSVRSNESSSKLNKPPPPPVVVVDPNNYLKITKKKKSKSNSKFDGEILNQINLDEGEEELDGLDAEDNQRMLIAEAFEDDEVVESFRTRKENEIEASKPKEIDLHLPGWGEWGGKDIVPNPKRRQRFIIKPPPKAPRKDARISHVILNEEAGKKIKEHQVKEVPFPFTRVKDFEKTIRAPIGRTWMPEQAVKTLTAPKVITRLGSIIEPLDEDVLTKSKDGQSKELKVPISIKRLAKVKK